MNKKKMIKILGILSIITGLQVGYMPQAEAGFLGGILFFPIKTAKKVTQTAGEGAVRVGGSVATKAGKKAGKAVVKEASPSKQLKRTKRATKHARNTSRIGYRIYGGFAK